MIGDSADVVPGVLPHTRGAGEERFPRGAWEPGVKISSAIGHFYYPASSEVGPASHSLTERSGARILELRANHLVRPASNSIHGAEATVAEAERKTANL